jgi:hypothetical protein
MNLLLSSDLCEEHVDSSVPLDNYGGSSGRHLPDQQSDHFQARPLVIHPDPTVGLTVD